MSKVTIQFDTSEPDQLLEMRRTLGANSAYNALWEISQELFRPARKHGYPHGPLAKALDEHPEVMPEIVGLLEERFYELLRENNIDLNDWT